MPLPVVTISQPSGRLLQGEHIEIEYQILDRESDLVFIEPSYSTDSGATFQLAKESGHPASQGVSNLSSSPAGTGHTFVWHAKDDLVTIPAQNIIFKILVNEGIRAPSALSILGSLSRTSVALHSRGTAATLPFSVGAPISSHPPEIKILSPLPNTAQASVIEFKYELKDADSDLIRIQPKYSIDGGVAYLPATERSFSHGSEGISNLSSSPAGETHSFFWDSEADLAALAPTPQIIFLIESFDSQAGGVAVVGSLDVDLSRFPPMIDIFSPTTGDSRGAPVAIEYVLTDFNEEIVRIEPYYSIDNGQSFLPASPAVGGNGIDNIQSSAGGDVLTFMWDASRDLPNLHQNNVRVKIQAFDNNAGGIDTSELFDVTVSIKPTVTLINPTRGSWGVPLPIDYTLSHPGGNQLLKLEVEYSLDQGQHYFTATEASNLGSEGLTDLLSTVDGENHFFVWDVIQDIPTLTAILSDVQLRLRASLASEIGEIISEYFDLDSGYVGVPQNNIPAGVLIRPPEIHVFDPEDHTGHHVQVRYLLKQADNLRCNVRVECTVNGAKIAPRMARYSDQLTNLAAPSVNADYRFIWDAKYDLDQLGLTSATVQMTFTPKIGSVEGTPHTTNPFTMVLEDPPSIVLPTPNTSLNNAFLNILEGDNQEVIPGLLAAENLVVELVDGSGLAVRNVRVTFSVEASSQVDATLETHPRYRTTTDYYGRAGIRVRPKPLQEGTLRILATVVGMPNLTAVLNLTSHIPQIILENNPLGPFAYGELVVFDFILDSDIDRSTVDFLYDEYDPIEFKVTTEKAVANSKIIRMPGANGGGNRFRVVLTPTVLGGSAGAPSTDACRLKIEAVNVEGVVPYDGSFSIQTENNINRLSGTVVTNNGWGNLHETFTEHRLHLDVVSGYDPSSTPTAKIAQAAYPGATLATPFRVKVLDDDGNEYNSSTDVMFVDEIGNCNNAAMNFPRNGLRIKWTVSGGDGLFSTSASRGTQNNLEVNVNQNVYFTPTSGGPWRVIAETVDYVLDTYTPGRDDVPKFGYNYKRGSPTSTSTITREYHCRSRPGIESFEHDFFVQLPESIGFEDVSKATTTTPGPLLKQVKAGMKSRILVSGLSPFTTSSNPDIIELESVMNDGNEIGPYTGTSLNFKHDFALSGVTHINSILRSQNILFVQNESVASSGIPHAILPLSWIKAKSANSILKFSVKTSGLKRQRHRWGSGSLNGNSEFLYEAPVGTSPTGGVSDSVTIHNGELIIDNCDLSFRSRVGERSINRTYRSQVQSMLDPQDESESIEPLGPGWFFDANMYLEAAHRHIRFWDGYGTYFDYPTLRPGKGQFIHITRNSDVTNEGAHVIRDRHRNHIHFNVDGTVRFIKDRFGNVFEYEYNEKAQLVKIKDCIQPDTRKYTIRYYEDTPENRQNQWFDRIEEIVDFDNRKINYEYYKGDEESNGVRIGGPGYLKRIIFAENETFLEGANSYQLFRSFETFEYEQHQKMGWILKTAFTLDSAGNARVLLTNYFDADGRVVRQADTSDEYTFDYSALHNIVYKDNGDIVTEFTFHDSLFWDATTSDEIARAGATTSLTHNYHGNLTKSEPPQGIGTVDYVYDEDTPTTRRHGDLLAEIYTSEDGKERTTTYTYSPRFHFPYTIVGPEGNLPGVDPALHRYVNNFDSQRGVGDAGNVVDSSGLRSLSLVYRPLPNGQRQPTWIEEHEKNEYTYNQFGLKKSYVNKEGIKTDYYYYSENSPTSGTSSQDGGGFLAQMRYDTELTPRRIRFLPGDDAKPQTRKTTYSYNALGHLLESNQEGIVTTYTPNKLGSIIKVEHGIGVSGFNHTTSTSLGPNGELIGTIVEQPGSGTQRIEEKYEYYENGLLKLRTTSVNNSDIGTEAHLHDKGRLTQTINSWTGITTNYTYDVPAREETITVVSSNTSLSTTKKYTANRILYEVSKSSGEKTRFTLNTFGDTVKATNIVTHNSAEVVVGISETIISDAGMPAVQIERSPNGDVVSAQELVWDGANIRRLHSMRFGRDLSSGPTGSVKKVPENLGIESLSFP